MAIIFHLDNHVIVLTVGMENRFGTEEMLGETRTEKRDPQRQALLFTRLCCSEGQASPGGSICVPQDRNLVRPGFARG